MVLDTEVEPTKVKMAKKAKRLVDEITTPLNFGLMSSGSHMVTLVLLESN